MSGFGEAAKTKARVCSNGPLVDVMRGTPVRSCKTTVAEIVRYAKRKYEQIVRPEEERIVRGVDQETLKVRSISKEIGSTGAPVSDPFQN